MCACGIKFHIYFNTILVIIMIFMLAVAPLPFSYYAPTMGGLPFHHFYFLSTTVTSFQVTGYYPLITLSSYLPPNSKFQSFDNTNLHKVYSNLILSTLVSESVKTQ